MPTQDLAVNLPAHATATVGYVPGAQALRRGFALGLLGVLLFAATLPMTKLAIGSDQVPHLSAWFVTFGRAAVAGVLSLFYLAWVRHSPASGKRNYPQGQQWALLAITALCVVVGFPLCMALALRQVPSIHGAVVTGLLPLATAVVAALWSRQRANLGFWLCAVMGSALVLLFMLLHGGAGSVAWQLQRADVLLLAAMLSAAIGYVAGAHLTPSLGAERVICWVLVMALPVTLPLALVNAPANSVPNASWLAFVYLALFSMWIGFFAWYRGLALGGAVRVSQVQLLQPFFSMVFAVPLLGEQLDAITLVFALAVVATVFIGKKLGSVQAPTVKPA